MKYFHAFLSRGEEVTTGDGYLNGLSLAPCEFLPMLYLDLMKLNCQFSPRS